MFGLTTWAFLFALLIVSLSFDGVAAGLLDGVLATVNQLLDATLGISLGGGALINVDLNAGVLANSQCTAQNKIIGVSVAVLGLVRVCACVGLGTGDTDSDGVSVYTKGLLGSTKTATEYACGTCPDHASPVCVTANGGGFNSAGGCACACEAGYYADTALKICVKKTTCVAPKGTLVSDTNSGATATCQCTAPYVRDSATGECSKCASGYTLQSDGTCDKLNGSQRARLRRKVSPGAEVEAHHIARRHGKVHAHAARAPAGLHHPAAPHAVAARAVGADAVFPQVSFSSSTSASAQCPEKGETACPLKSGEFECVDTTSDLASCGGCVGVDGEGPGENCLAIPGALKVECYQSRCQVASCFSGWYFDGSRCAKGERA